MKNTEFRNESRVLCVVRCSIIESVSICNNSLAVEILKMEFYKLVCHKPPALLLKLVFFCLVKFSPPLVFTETIATTHHTYRLHRTINREFKLETWTFNRSSVFKTYVDIKDEKAQKYRVLI